MRDKNITLIYEGDVLDVRIYEPHQIGVVYWDSDWAAWAIYYKNGEYDNEKLCDLFGAEKEIIGNIHDNPELLEAEQ